VHGCLSNVESTFKKKPAGGPPAGSGGFWHSAERGSLVLHVTSQDFSLQLIIISGDVKLSN
jgi:hypothetical protein